MTTNILDCTLRDGGYYNNWDFSPEIVASYLEGIANSNIEYVELGLRNFPKEGFMGAFAYTTESFLNTLELPVGPTYGVMIDAKTILQSKLTVEEAVDALFIPSIQSKINLVRVAAHFSEVEMSGPIVKHLKKLGYMVGYNLMQAGGKEDDIISNKAKQASEWEGLDVLYFADSLGNMDNDEVTRIVGALRKNWKGPLGIHTHNNMGKGLDNTLTAKNIGVSWLDATITGMGRGAGNTQTESLLAVLDKSGSKYNPKPVYEVVIRHFETMQKSYGWGSNLLYFLGAQNDVHPTYIQNLLSNTHYGTDEIIGAIDYLSSIEGTTSYNGVVLETALTFTDNKSVVTSTSVIKGFFDNKNILIIANAPSSNKYASAIENYIKQVKPIVISLNIVTCISEDLIDYYCISHNSKFLSDASKYKKLCKPIILPKHRFNQKELGILDGLDVIDFGISVVKDELSINDTYSVIPYDITVAYVLAILLDSKVNAVYTVGFDGYEPGDVRQQEMIEALNLYNKHQRSVDLTSLTPTTYPMQKASVYAPTF